MIKDKIKAKLTESIKARDMERVSVLRMLISAINNKEIAFRSQEGLEMKDKHVIKVIQKEIKQRQDSIESYEKGGREDLVEKEKAEMDILTGLLEEFTPEESQHEQS